jgi:tricorn protease
MNDACRGTVVAALLGALLVAGGAGKSASAEQFDGPLVLEGATIHRDNIVFGCGGILWQVASAGGAAKAMTTGETGHDSLPRYSPDGKQVAFLRRSERLSGRAPASPEDAPPLAASYDVYSRVLDTGEELRLTYHPARDFPVGWSPDSQRVLLNSSREGVERLFTMAPGEQLPTALPLPRAYSGTFSPDGKQLAYLPRSLDYHFSEFPYYRGGKCSPLWLIDLATLEVQKLTDDTSNVRDPMWVGEKIYFLLDKAGKFNLHVYDTTAKAISELARFNDFGPRGAATDGKSIVVEGDGGLRVFDIASQTIQNVKINVQRDDSALRPRIVNAVSQVQSYSLSRDGKQAVVSARGDVFLVDTTMGRAANITKTSGVAERNAQLSGDGRRLAYFSDARGEYELRVRDIATGKETAMPIEPHPSYYRELTLSPDDHFAAFADKRLGVWLADLSSGSVKRIDVSPSSAQDEFLFNWSHDSRYLAYSKHGDNRLPRIYVYDVRADRVFPLTPEDAFATSPTFDQNGRYLYFLSSSNAPAADYGWGVLAGLVSRPLVVRQLNAVVLRAEDASPTAIASSGAGAKPRTDDRPVDFDGIEGRIVAINIAPHSPSAISAGENGILYVTVEEWPSTPGAAAEPGHAIYRLDVRAPEELRKVIPIVDRCEFSHDGKTAVCSGAGGWRVATFAGRNTSLKPLAVTALPSPVEPAREWKQIAHEAWRAMRDGFYDPGTHGVDWPAVERRYAAFLPGVRSREELNVLMRRMLGSVSVSHLRVLGGDVSANLNEPETVGLLGAEFEVSEGRYRIKRVLRAGRGTGRDASIRAPLAELGSEVAPGEYLLAVEDQPLDAKQNIYEALRGRASRGTRLLVGPTTDPRQARTLRVVPVASEQALRLADWAENNRQTVERLSEGKLGYFMVPEYSAAGVQAFLRGYFGNRTKRGIIIDQRYNGGGITPDFLIEMLARRPLYYYRFREGDDLAVPVNGRSASSTVLLINEDNASAAETFAFMFQLAKLGPIVGRRTFGAGIGPYGAGGGTPPVLVDGGRLNIPSRGAYNPAGAWGIENEGIKPDVSVEVTPEDFRDGRDSQLEAAVRAGLEDIERIQPSPPQRPEFPVHP